MTITEEDAAAPSDEGITSDGIQPDRAASGPKDADHRRRLHRREVTLIALIALIAGTAAAATWRAEVAGTRAAFDKQQGVAIRIQTATDKVGSRIDAVRGAQQVVNVQAFGDELGDAVAEAPAASTTPSYSGVDQALASQPIPPHLDLATSTALVSAQTYEWALRASWPWNNFVHPVDHRFGLDAEKVTASRADADALPVDAARYFGRSERFEHHRLLLLYVDLALVGALTLAAIGRLVVDGRGAMLLAASSGLVLIAALVALLHLEVR